MKKNRKAREVVFVCCQREVLCLMTSLSQTLNIIQCLWSLFALYPLAILASFEGHSYVGKIVMKRIFSVGFFPIYLVLTFLRLACTLA